MPEEIEVQTAKDIRRIVSSQENLDLQKENKKLMEENTELTLEIHKKLDKLLTDVNEVKIKQSDMEEKLK
jgi:hypothetical protein